MTAKKKPAIARTVDQLAGSANPLNPRKITPEQLKMLADSLRRFGDLSGLILNVLTNHLVGGHQRVKVLGSAPVKITKRYDKPTPNGTTAEGFVIFEGERYTYREVSWDAATENAAMIAANKHGGDWDFPMLSELLLELDTGEFDVSLTGFSDQELEKMVRGVKIEGKDEIQPLSKEEMDLLPAHIRMVQLFMTIETLPPFRDKMEALKAVWGTDNVTDTVVKAVEICYTLHHGDTTTESTNGSGSETGLPDLPRPDEESLLGEGSAD
jgi:hypothetical protein